MSKKPKGKDRPIEEVVEGIARLIRAACVHIAEEEGEQITLIKIMQEALNEASIRPYSARGRRASLTEKAPRASA